MASRLIPVHPFLARYATARSGEPSLPGRFDARSDVWVIDDANGTRPLIELCSDFGDTSTLTRVQAERDDTDLDAGLVAGTSTFTKVAVEGDDTDVSCTSLLEVTTKTYAQIESEDTAFTINAFDAIGGDRPALTLRIQ